MNKPNTPNPQAQQNRRAAPEPDMNLQTAQAKVSGMEAPRVSEEFMKSQLSSVQYHQMGHTTICLMELYNGFRVIGHSTPASPSNFDPDIGQRYAYENAFRQLWPFFGFRLRDALCGGVSHIHGARVNEGEPDPLPQKSWHGQNERNSK